jgi:hypothetical protein
MVVSCVERGEVDVSHGRIDALQRPGVELADFHSVDPGGDDRILANAPNLEVVPAAKFLIRQQSASPPLITSVSFSRPRCLRSFISAAAAW